MGYRTCIELGIQPIYKTFVGTETDAINFILRTNKRRNLTSSQWAAIAVEAEDIVKTIQQAVEIERRAKQAETQRILEETKKEPSFFEMPTPMCQLIDT